MADNSATFSVKVDVNGQSFNLAQNSVKNLGAAVKDATKAQAGLGAASDDLFDKQNKGVIGVGNSTKSFSKLAQTIGSGGSSSLVGAYATLAANTFALTAAFGALKSAAQLDQIFRGLESAGARSGQSLDVAADKLRQVTGNAISMKQALTSTAQVISGGFSTKDLARLGQVAKDSSFALGRDLTDSLDRLTRGVVKLEPELLDELGILTKINDSSSAYAQQLGKSVSSLTNYQKRQGFLNAVIAEATLKFGGLSEAAGNSKAYDQLGATFENLKNSVLNVANEAIIPLVATIAGSPASLAGVAVLFASTISKQLLPGLDQLGERTRKAAAESRAHIAEVQKEVISINELAVAEKAATTAKARNSLDIIPGGNKKYNQVLLGEIEEGLRPAQDGVDQLTRSLTSLKQQYRTLEDKGASFDDPRLISKAKLISATADELALLKTLAVAETAEADTFTEAAQNKLTLQYKIQAAEAETIALERQAGAIGAAAQGEYSLAIKETIAALSAQKEALLANQAEKISGPEKGSENYEKQVAAAKAAKQAAKDAANEISTGFARAEGQSLSLGNKINLVGSAAKLSGKVIGTAFLQAIPIIGEVALAYGLLTTAIDFFKSDSAKATDQAFVDLNKIIGETVSKADALVKANESTAAAGLRTQQALTIQSNAVKELRDAYDEALKKRKDFEKQEKEGGVVGTARATFDPTFKSQASYATGLTRDNEALGLLSKRNVYGEQNKALNGAVATIGAYLEVAPEATKEALKLAGGIDAINKRSDESKVDVLTGIIDKLGSKAESTAGLISDVADALKNANTAVGDFATAALPSTQFTAASKSLNAVTQSLANIDRAVTSGQANAKDYIKVLDEAGPNLTNLLSPGTNKTLQAVRAQDTIKQTLSEQDRVYHDLNDSQKAQLAGATEYLDKHVDIYSTVKKELQVANDLFLNAQKAAVIDAQRLSILQAYAAANSSNFAATGAGELARIKNLNEQVSVQQHTLNTQKDILELQLSTNLSKVNQLRLESGILDIQDRAVKLAQKNALTAQSQFYNQRALKSGSTADRNKADAASKAASDVQAAIDKYDSSLDQQKQNELQQLAIEGVMKQIEALGLNITTNAQASAQAAAKDVSFLTQKLSNLQAQRTIIQANYDQAVKLDRALNNTTDTLASAIQDLDTARDRSAATINDKYATSIATTQNQIAQATADIAKTGQQNTENGKAQLDQLNDQLKVQISSRDLELEQVSITHDLGVLEKVIFDTRKEGLEMQQSALENLQKQLDAQKSLSDATRENATARLALRLRSGGLGNSAGFQQSQEIRVALDAYKIAVQQAEVKKASIDAEYALLDAQRLLLRQQLSTQRDTIAASKEYGVSPALQTQVSQLDATLSNLGKLDLAASAEYAKRAIDVATDTAKIQLQTAIRPDVAGNGTDLLSVVSGAQERERARQEAKGVLNSNIQGQSVTGIVGPNTLTDNTLKPLIDQTKDQGTALNAQINTVISTLQEIANNTKPAGASNLGSNTSLNGNVKTAYDYLQKSGAFSATAIAGILGNLQQESGSDLNNQISKDGVHKGIAQLGFANQAEFIRQFGIEVANAPLDKQLQFIVNELKKTPGALNLLNASKTFADAADQFEKIFEKSGGSALGAREANATAIGNSTTRTISSSGSVATDTAASASNDNENPQIVVTAAKSTKVNVGASAVPDKLAVSTLNTKTDVVPAASPEVVTAVEKAQTAVDIYNSSITNLKQNLSELGPNGDVITSLLDGFSTVSQSITTGIANFTSANGNSTKQFIAVAQVASSAISTVEGLISSSAKAREAAIDSQISQEEALDGKSAASVAKIDALQKKKDSIAKKAFETNKKLMIANALISTAAGIAGALAAPFGLGIPLAIAIGAMGAAEVAIIAGTQYQSTYTPAAVTAPSTLSIGGSGNNSVNLAKQNSNVGGELGYLRGTPGSGSNSANYSVVGSAYGGSTSRSYGPTAYVVGEKGPEILAPDTSMRVTPMNDNQQATPLNATFQIQAIDSQGVAEMLHGQRGNIISMLREAANANGQTFLESVDTNVYTRPGVSRL